MLHQPKRTRVKAVMNILQNSNYNGVVLKAVAISAGIGYWVLVFQSRARDIQQGGYAVDPVTKNPIGMAGTPIDLGYAFVLFLVIYFPPILWLYMLGVQQRRDFASYQEKVRLATERNRPPEFYI